MNHTELQEAVRHVATLCGWRILHVRRSIGKGQKWVTATSIVGWPDLFLWHPYRRRTLAVELKVPPDRLSPEQFEVLGSLADAGVEVGVWTPADVEHLGALLFGTGPRNERATVRVELLPRGAVGL